MENVKSRALAEFNDIYEEWEDEYEALHYNPVPILEKMSLLFEKHMTSYYKAVSSSLTLVFKQK